MIVEKIENTVTLPAEIILTRVGEFGRFQKLVGVIFGLIYFFLSFQILIMNFTTITPPWKYVSNSSTCLFNGTQQGKDTRRCDISRSQWYYTEPTQYSIVTQFNIHCDEQWLLELLSSIHFVGWGIGAIILGWIGDRYGRKILLFPSAAALLVIGFVSSFMPNVYLIIVCRFFVGFFIPGVLVQANILISEMVSIKQRPMATLIPFLSLPIGYSILGLKAYLLQNWKMQSIACTAPYVISLPFYPIIPESFSWLQVNGRIDEAMTVFHKIARWNKKNLASNIVISSADVITSNSVQTHSNGRIILQTLIQCFIWMTISISFFGLQFAAKGLGGSMYRDFVILAMVQLPAIIFSIVVCNKFGRKKSTLTSLLFTGVASLAISFIPANEKLIIARVIIGTSGKLFAAVAFQSSYIWSVEIFPTYLRSRGMGTLQVAARIGATSAPWVVNGLTAFGPSVPFVVMGIPPLVGSILGMWLPETKDVKPKVQSNANNKTANNKFNEPNEIGMEEIETDS